MSDHCSRIPVHRLSAAYDDFRSISGLPVVQKLSVGFSTSTIRHRMTRILRGMVADVARQSVPPLNYQSRMHPYFAQKCLKPWFRAQRVESRFYANFGHVKLSFLISFLERLQGLFLFA